MIANRKFDLHLRCRFSSRQIVWRTGYTLFELLLVLAILAVIALLTFPNAGRIYDSYRLKQVTAKVQMHLRAARIHAIDAGVPYAFCFEPGGTHYVIIEEGSAGEQSAKSESDSRARWRFSGKLPAAFRFQASDRAVRTGRLRAGQLAGFEHAEDLALISWSQLWWFYPDGTADERTLAVAASQASMRLSVRGLTGDVIVERVASKEKQ